MRVFYLLLTPSLSADNLPSFTEMKLYTKDIYIFQLPSFLITALPDQQSFSSLGLCILAPIHSLLKAFEPKLFCSIIVYLKFIPLLGFYP